MASLPPLAACSVLLLSSCACPTAVGASALQEVDGQTFEATDDEHAFTAPIDLRIDHGQLALLSSLDDEQSLGEGPVEAHRHGHAVQLSAPIDINGLACHVDAQITAGAIEIFLSVPGRPMQHAHGRRVLPQREIPDALAHAHTLHLAHQPKQAIPLLQLVLDTDRFDLPDTAPALVELVDCYQMLSSDHASAKAYASFAATWLSQPPPLDGHSSLTLEQAESDLLWHGHPGPDGKPQPLVRFTVDSVRESTSTGTGQSPSAPQLDINLKGTLPAGIRLHFPDANANDAALLQAFRATAPDHRVLTPSYVYVRPTIGTECTCTLSFPSPGEEVHAFDVVTGSIPCTQDTAWKILSVPLVQGSTWEEPGAHVRLSSITSHDTTWQVTIESTSTDPKARQGGASSSASSSASFSRGGRHVHQSGDPNAPYWLVDAAGERSYPYGKSVASAGGTTRVSLTLDAWGSDPNHTPSQLQVRVVTATVAGVLPVELHHVELP